MKQNLYRTVITLVLLLQCTGCVYMNFNMRTVTPGKVFRSGQMPDWHLETTIKSNNIKTVINLRGVTPEESWWQEEKAICGSIGVAHHDLDWSGDRLPEPDSLRQFVEIIDKSPGPVLFHCQAGTHRAGVAAACVILLEGHTVEEARKQFTIFFGDAHIGRLLDLYEGSELPFREWVELEYPGIYKNET